MNDTLKYQSYPLRRFDSAAFAVATAGLAVLVAVNMWALAPYIAAAIFIVRLP